MLGQIRKAIDVSSRFDVAFRLSLPGARKGGDSYPDRNGQFDHIQACVRQYLGLRQPVILVDAKNRNLQKRRPGLDAAREAGKRARA
jgi:hypothetical protein